MSSARYRPSPARSEVKQIRRELCITLCRKCMAKEGTKQCSKCKTAYCSTQCQKEDWPDHKGLCALHVEGGPDLKKLCQILMSNLLLRHYIEVLIILKLELLQRPNTDEPFRAQIVIGFEPTSIGDFFNLFKPSSLIDASPLQGMLQIHQILPERDDFGGVSKAAAFPRSELDKRRMASCLSGLEDRPFGYIQFIYGFEKKVTFCCIELLIQKESMDRVRQGKELEIPGTAIKKTLSEYSCTELINTLIRRDAKNRWLLRINMAQAHKQTIKDTSVLFSKRINASGAITSTPSDDPFAEATFVKMVHESIYLEYLQGFLRDRQLM